MDRPANILLRIMSIAKQESGQHGLKAIVQMFFQFFTVKLNVGVAAIDWQQHK
jgi:hypothetical protein